MPNERPTILIPHDAEFSVATDGPVVTHLFLQGETVLMALSLHPGTFSLPPARHSKLTVIAGAIEFNEGGKLRVLTAGESVVVASDTVTLLTTRTFSQGIISIPRVPGGDKFAPANNPVVGPRPHLPSQDIRIISPNSWPVFGY